MRTRRTALDGPNVACAHHVRKMAHRIAPGARCGRMASLAKVPRPRRRQVARISLQERLVEAEATDEWWTVGLEDLRNVVDVESDDHLRAVFSACNANPICPTPVVVEFYGHWCPACKAMHAKVVELMRESPETLFVRVPFDHFKKLCKFAGVTALPFFQFYNGAGTPFGKPADGFAASRAPMRMEQLRQAVVENAVPRCTLQRLPQDFRPESYASMRKLHKITFTWELEFGRVPPKEVLLTGEVLGSWGNFMPMSRNTMGDFQVQVPLPAGSYEYKFIVDGQWRTHPDLLVVSDDGGFKNHKIHVTSATWPLFWTSA